MSEAHLLTSWRDGLFECSGRKSLELEFLSRQEGAGHFLLDAFAYRGGVGSLRAFTLSRHVAPPQKRTQRRPYSFTAKPTFLAALPKLITQPALTPFCLGYWYHDTGTPIDPRQLAHELRNVRGQGWTSGTRVPAQETMPTTYPTRPTGWEHLWQASCLSNMRFDATSAKISTIPQWSPLAATPSVPSA